MLAVYSGPPPADAILRGRLKHSWLENEVLNKTGEQVVFLRRSQGWPELHGFHGPATEAHLLADRIEPGFSPARLVDECPSLNQLDDADRQKIRRAVHAAYLEVFDVQKVAADLKAAAKDMSQTIDDLLTEWNKDNMLLSDAALKARWEVVLARASILREVLDALPRGTVLP